jgi:DNA-binding NtrC family response regulator
MWNLEDEIRSASEEEARVMLTGESGVGKRFAADRIHQLSRRQVFPFVAVTGAHIVETDALHHEALLHAANHGTLLVQEIEKLSAPAQLQLLRFVERTNTNGVSVRLMTATSVPLVGRVNAGEFRGDLFYRLNVIHLVIPPLRERPSEIPLIFDHYLSLHAHERAQLPQLSSAARQRLVEYSWPGNVTELKTVIQELCERELPRLIEPRHLPRPIGE